MKGKADNDDLSGLVIGAAIRVHRALGPGLLESAYQACLPVALRLRGLQVDEQVEMPIVFEGVRVNVGYRLDLVVERQLVVELKAVSRVLPIHHAQLLSHLRLGDFKTGLLMNFHVLRMTDGIVRLSN